MNAFLSYRMDQQTAQGLEQTIMASTIETFDQIFGYKLSFSPVSGSYNADSIVAHVEFWENFETFNVCFVFSKELIMSLMKSVYEDDTLTKEGIDEICKDAVCELVNIISNRIKLYINEQGFNSVMEIPTAEIITTIDPEDMPHNIKMNFRPLNANDMSNVIYVGLQDAA